MEELLKKIAPWLLLAFAAFVILMLNVGWPALAKNYPGQYYRNKLSKVTWLNYAKLPRNDIRLTIGTMQKSDENVNIGSSEDGLYIDSLSIWTVFRPPLYIPWADIDVEWSEMQVPVVNIPIRSATLRLRKVPNLSISLSGPLARDLLAHAPQRLSQSSFPLSK